MNPNTIFSIPLSIRWADLDPNFHLRHGVYYDFGSQIRVQFLEQHGLTVKQMQELHFGPILFREECLFKKEIRPSDTIFVNLELLKLKKDYSKFSFRHQFTREDGTLCAVLNIDGAWMDTQLRKIYSPPALVVELMDKMPKGEDFEWI